MESDMPNADTKGCSATPHLPDCAWLAAIVDSSTDAVIGLTPEGSITSWNGGAQRLFGYSAEEAVGEPFSILVPPDRNDESARLLARARKGERIAGHETVRRRKGGRRVDVSLSLSPITDEADAVVGISTSARDISERKLVERALAEAQERQRLAIEAAHLGMWFWHIKDDHLEWTPLCRKMHGIKPQEELTYERFLASIHFEDREKTERAVAWALEEHPEYRMEYRVVWPDGEIRWISVLGRAFHEYDEPIRMMGVTMDVTDQKRAEQERADLLEREKAARAEAQAAMRAKDEFLAVLSHELRTPLQSMLGWTQVLLSRERDSRTVRRGLQTIERNARTQAQLIEDLLDVSRIVAGKLRLERRLVDLAPVVEAAVESAKSAAQAKGIQVEVAIQPVGAPVLGDPDRLEQVVANLLSNATKFTPAHGAIQVRLERVGERARITVADTGCGIPGSFLPHVFDRFRQAESSTARSYGGLGLGLAIVRHIVDEHEGTVAAESPGEGRGATFTVTLPLASAEQRRGPATEELDDLPREGAGARARLDGLRVLVVDDDPDACELLAVMLREAGAEVAAAESTRGALDVLSSFAPHVVVSDIGMPEEDGYSLIRQVRACDESARRHTAAVALTAFASQPERDQALALGFEAHLSKPVSPAELTRTVAKVAERAS